MGKTLIIDVPGRVNDNKCTNSCKYCFVDRNEIIETHLSNPRNWCNLDNEKYAFRMMYTKDAGSSTLIFSGTIEPMQNVDFIRKVLDINNGIPSPFAKIEVQTTMSNAGNLLRETDARSMFANQISTLSISLSSLDEKENIEYNGMVSDRPDAILFEAFNHCKQWYNIRFSLNLTKAFNRYDTVDKALEMFKRCKELGADQVTLRRLYDPVDIPGVSKWVNANRIDIVSQQAIFGCVNMHGVKIASDKWSLDGMSVMLDEDCMDEDNTKINRFILRKNGKLYTKWNDPGSLVF